MKKPVDTRRPFFLDEMCLMDRERKYRTPRRLSKLLCASIVFASAAFVKDSFSAADVKMLMIHRIVDKSTGRLISSGVRVAKSESECLDFSIEEILRFQQLPDRTNLRLETSCDPAKAEKDA